MKFGTTLKNLFRLKVQNSTNDDAQPPPYDYGIKFQSNEHSDTQSTNPVVAPKQAFDGRSGNKPQSNEHSDTRSANPVVAPMQAFYGNPKFYGNVQTVNIRSEAGGSPADCDEFDFSDDNFFKSRDA